jgi:hypothetical protein
MLDINPEKVRQVITEARMIDAKEDITDSAVDAAEIEDVEAETLESPDRDPVYAELREYIRSLDEDEQIALVALAWIGRGTYDASEYSSAMEEARRAHNKRTAEYLLGLPMLGDYLEEGLSAIETEEDDQLGGEALGQSI